VVDGIQPENVELLHVLGAVFSRWVGACR
jgi:hypothetical protein